MRPAVKPPARATQADIDTWPVQHTSHHNVLRAFFAWSATNKLTRRFELPRIQIRGAAPLTQHRRLTMLRRLLTCAEGPRHARAAAIGADEEWPALRWSRPRPAGRGRPVRPWPAGRRSGANGAISAQLVADQPSQRGR